MPTFITRIELFHASEKDQVKLDAAMKAALFSDTIQDLTNNITYRLPPNMYSSSSPNDSSFVLRLAQQAARKTRRNYSAITMQSDGICFTGLEKVVSYTEQNNL